MPRDPEAKQRVLGTARLAQANAPLRRSAPDASQAPDPSQVPPSSGVEARGASPPRAAVVPQGAVSKDAQAPAARAPTAVTARSLPQARARPTGPYAELSIEQLQKHVADCRACALCETRSQTVFSRGTGASGICFIGEGPGADEDAQGEPFVGAAGQLLDKMIGAMGLGRDEVYVCNVVKCRPPENRKPAIEEMAACSGYLRRQLEIISPEVIVALGGTAVTGLLGLTEGITRLRGTFRLYNGSTPVMPTFHPAYLLRTPAAKREVWSDLLQVLSHVGRAPPARS